MSAQLTLHGDIAWLLMSAHAHGVKHLPGAEDSSLNTVGIQAHRMLSYAIPSQTEEKPQKLGSQKSASKDGGM